jgi:predicted house-cleaning NTP pyrophosphatase (Maf/HAM1 superfamily)
MGRWNQEELSLLQGLQSTDTKKISSVAKKTKRSFMSVYSKIWTMNKPNKKRKKRRIIKELTSANNHQVRVTGGYVIVSNYKHISLKDGNVRVKL